MLEARLGPDLQKAEIPSESPFTYYLAPRPQPRAGG